MQLGILLQVLLATIQGSFFLHVFVAFAGQLDYLKQRIPEFELLKIGFYLVFGVCQTLPAYPCRLWSGLHRHAMVELFLRKICASAQRRGSQKLPKDGDQFAVDPVLQNLSR